MKKFYFLLMLLAIVVTSYAQMGWDSTGLPIRNGVNIEWFRAGTATNDGKIVYVWSDTRNGDRDVWAQKVDENGNSLWGEGGKLINGEINRQEDIVLIGSGDGIITAWIDYRSDEGGDVYAQRLDGNGNPLWQASGLPIAIASDIQISLNIVSDGSEGAFIIWVDHRDGNAEIYGTHVLADGTIATGWNENGNIIVQEPGTQLGHTFWEDGQGGAILVWTDKQVQQNDNLFAQRISADGSLLWGEHGITISNEINDQSSPKISPDGTGNFIVTWRDKKNHLNGDIYAQRLNLDGDKLWTNDLLVYGDDDYQENPRIRTSDDGGVFITWQDGRNEENTEDIYVQKISPEGNLLWDTDGVPVVTQPFNQKNPRIVGDNNGGCWIIWDDARDNDFPNIDIYIQHIDSNGTPQLTENGEVVCNAEGVQFAPLVKKSTTGYIFANWGDGRGGFTGIYYQTYDSNGNALLENNGDLIFTGLSGNATSYKMVKNYYGEPSIFWVDSRFASGQRKIYLQSVNHYGSLILPENGAPASPLMHPSNQDDIYDITINYVQNEIGVAWKNQIEDADKIFARVNNSSGNPIWGADGVSVVTNYSDAGTCRDPHISCIDPANSSYMVAWSDSRIVDINFTYKIYAQKFDANGNRLWGDAGKQIQMDETGFVDYFLKIAIDDYLIWEAQSQNNTDLFVTRVDENGNHADGWSNSGLALSTAINYQESPKAYITPQGLLVVWKDSRNGDIDIYGQLVSPSGDILWEEDGKALVVGERDQMLSNLVIKDGYFALDWSDKIDTNVSYIKEQRFDYDGTPLWNDDITVADGTFDHSAPYQTSTDSNNFYVFWTDYRTGVESNLYAQKVDEAGNLLWDTSGLLVCDALKNQNTPLAVTDNDNYVYTLWQDTRSSGKSDIYSLYAQMFIGDSGIDDNNIPNDNLNISLKNYPNPFVSSTKIFIDSKGKDINGTINIYNLKGQIVNKITPENNSVKWDGKNSKGKNLPSGIYFYKLVTKKGSSATKKMILVK